ncbi:MULTISPECIES: hypothetical protein [Roseomonadaceae]|uniref:Uncharacterized protein n=1 Tax=Falsiroseomonas oleicola TaxID=2801474 RepID=A0ABS6HDU6_9PROT|nr:hypothetical protein [Roseomonas oleicola]MBU8546907.1 hypothetical protein [Roseomonas oleicola]
MVLALALPLAACASGATPGAMTVPLSPDTIIAEGSGLRQAIATGTLGGGQETNPMWTSQVSNEAFATALRQSLGTHAMLAIQGGRFRLDATLGTLRQPLMGASLEVTSTVAYRLTAVASGAVVFERTIEAAYTAPFSAAFAAVERLRLANEGSVRENIRQFLAALVAEEARNPQAFRAGTPIS